jgi:CheY-like chemotaxis protein
MPTAREGYSAQYHAGIGVFEMEREMGTLCQPVASQAGSGKRRVLVVDDNRDITMSCARLLEYAGHEVRVAFDGLQALEVARVYRPDVALVDVGLPGIDGYELVRRLRDEFGPDVLLIIITAYARERKCGAASKGVLGSHNHWNRNVR